MEEVSPSRGTVECGEGLPLLDGVQEARAEQGTGVTEEVCRDNGVLRMQLPDVRRGIEDLLGAAEGATERSSATKVFLWDAMNDCVPPSLPLLASTARGLNVASLRDVNRRPARVWKATVSNESGRDEVRWWRW